jgi:hypothetical protein
MNECIDYLLGTLKKRNFGPRESERELPEKEKEEKEGDSREDKEATWATHLP